MYEYELAYGEIIACGCVCFFCLVILEGDNLTDEDSVIEGPPPCFTPKSLVLIIKAQLTIRIENNRKMQFFQNTIIEKYSLYTIEINITYNYILLQV